MDDAARVEAAQALVALSGTGTQAMITTANEASGLLTRAAHSLTETAAEYKEIADAFKACSETLQQLVSLPFPTDTASALDRTSKILEMQNHCLLLWDQSVRITDKRHLLLQTTYNVNPNMRTLARLLQDE